MSKTYLSGKKAFDRILIRPADFWSTRDVALMLGRRVDAIDPEAHNVTTETGEMIGYGQLIWAAGGHPRRLTCPGSHLVGVHTMRNRTDVDAIKQALKDTRQVAVIGGGYIGLEAASVCRQLGLEVTILEVQNRVLARVAGERLARFYEAEHRAQGADVRLAARAERIESDGSRAVGVRLSSGAFVPATTIVVGIGIVPSLSPLQHAGAECKDGVVVDEHGRTSLRDIWAIGDCATQEHPFGRGERARIESVQNANEMARVLAGCLMGEAPPLRSPPFFWSDQYDLRLQTVGLSTGYDAEVVRGDPARRSFSIIYLRAGRAIAMDCVNATKDYVHGRSLLALPQAPSPSALADTARPLDSLCAQAAA